MRSLYAELRLRTLMRSARAIGCYPGGNTPVPTRSWPSRTVSEGPKSGTAGSVLWPARLPNCCPRHRRSTATPARIEDKAAFNILLVAA